MGFSHIKSKQKESKAVLRACNIPFCTTMLSFFNCSDCRKIRVLF